MNQYPQHQPKQSMSTGAKVGLFGCALPFGVLLLMGGCGVMVAAVSEDTSTTDVAEEGTTTEQDVEEVDEAEEEDSTVLGDGIHQVGEDIEPGVYTTDGPSEDSVVPNCYYARLSGLSGEFEDIISNNNTEGSGTVEVSESDAALELSGGCEWELMD